MCLAVAANRLLAGLTLDWILQHVVADAAHELCEEGLDLSDVIDLVLFEYIFLVLTTFFDNLLHG